MTQIIIYDESEMNALIKQRNHPQSEFRMEPPRYNRLLNEIYAHPASQSMNGEHTNVVTFLAHFPLNKSPFVKRIQRSEAHGNSEWKDVIEKALIKIYQFYSNKTISGDLLIHKTHSTARFELEQWPIVRKRRTKYEAWFITGMTQWIDDLLTFVQKPTTREALGNWSYERKTDWLLTHSKMTKGMLKHYRGTNATNMLFKRAYWVWAIRRYHNTILWSEIIWNGVPRAGVAVYINGRAYCVQYGKEMVDFKVYQRANRYNAQEVGLPFAPYVCKSEHHKDPDFISRFVWWRHNRNAGRANDVDCDPADMWPEESAPDFFPEVTIRNAIRDYREAAYDDDEDEER